MEIYIYSIYSKDGHDQLVLLKLRFLAIDKLCIKTSDIWQCFEGR